MCDPDMVGMIIRNLHLKLIMLKSKENMKRKLQKKIYKENKRMEFYCIYFDLLNTTRIRLFVKCLETKICIQSHYLR